MSDPLDNAPAPLNAGDAADKLWDLIADIQVAMMTTIDDEGTLRSRPMHNVQKDFHGDIWFFTRASAAKAFEIQRHHEVNLVYAEPKNQAYVSVSGIAEMVRDRGKVAELWHEMLTTWFPQGIDDPDIALLKIAVQKAEYWDAPSNAMVYLYGYAKARLTGQSPKMGDHAKLAG